MGSYWLVQQNGFHFCKKKMCTCATIRPRLFSLLQAVCHLVLISSVHVATLAMQPRHVELWKCRVQHLRQFYGMQKHKQRGTSLPVYTDDLTSIPALMMSWLVMVCSTLLLARNLDTVTDPLSSSETPSVFITTSLEAIKSEVTIATHIPSVQITYIWVLC